jgi:hypothetical protein
MEYDPTPPLVGDDDKSNERKRSPLSNPDPSRSLIHQSFELSGPNRHDFNKGTFICSRNVMYASTKLPKHPDHRLRAMNGLLLKEGKGPLRLLYRLVSHVHLLTYRKARCSQQLRKVE